MREKNPPFFEGVEAAEPGALDTEEGADEGFDAGVDGCLTGVAVVDFVDVSIGGTMARGVAALVDCA